MVDRFELSASFLYRDRDNGDLKTRKQYVSCYDNSAASH